MQAAPLLELEPVLPVRLQRAAEVLAGRDSLLGQIDRPGNASGKSGSL